MRATLSWRRRLILGMSIEDARSKFDSPESRVALRLAHERYNQGLYHDLAIAQKRRNRLPPERKCHLVRHTKPSVKGFQAYIKSCPGDYVVREIWRDDECGEERPTTVATIAAVNEAGTALSSTVGDAPAEGGLTARNDDGDEEKAKQSPGGSVVAARETEVTTTDISSEGNLALTPTKNATHLSLTSHVGRQISEDVNIYEQHRAVVLEGLARAATTIGDDVHLQLKDRRKNSTLLAIRQNSVVDRLVDNVKEARDKGYTTLSSSSHLLEPLVLSLNLCGKKDKQLLDAFYSPFICLPAEERNISFSLWVAGCLLEKVELGTEFPYHIAKHAEPEEEEDGVLLSSGIPPKANIEIYFSPELYQLRLTLGMDGVVALRRFIGRAMKRQHDPLPTTSSIFLNMGQSQQKLCGLCSGESTQIPWLHLIKTKVSSTTGTILDIASDEAPSPSAIRESIHLVWRIWGHLVKDLHVHGDLDYLYISVWPQVENQSVNKPKGLSGNVNKEQLPGIVDEQTELKQQALPSIRRMDDAVNGLMEGNNFIWKSSKSRKLHTKNIFLPTDFVVVECVLEKKGLPHRLVVEDIVESLTELQRDAMEMQRLAVLSSSDEASNKGKKNSNIDDDDDDGGGGGGGGVRPVLYAPKVAVSHAGVIDAAAHSFQRIRIRGSCIAHVEALARVLHTGEHFTERKGLALIEGRELTDDATPLLPPNLSFSATHSMNHTYAAGRQLLGHRVPSGYTVQRTASGRFCRHQILQPLQSMVVDKEEREFWRTHYYRLSDIRLVFHDRVCAADIENPSGWSSSLKEQIHTIGQQRGSKQFQSKEDGAGSEMEEADDTTTRSKKLRKKKSKPKRAAAAAATAAVTLEEVVATISPEKIFEFLCVDMEVESASYDFRIGDNDGYAYNVKLRRIPESHFHFVKPAMCSLEEKGFINYFGPQRFASYTKHNMHPGLHLLKGEFRAAANIIVQQFYLDADLAAEKRRTGAALPKIYHSKGMGFRLPDHHHKLNSSGRSIAEHGTTLQSILDSALQATSLLGEDQEKGSSIDPCEEAFLRVVGPNACLMLVHEFLAFVWNDIVNQRLQRYGTFAILPGDLVRKNPLASPHSTEFGSVVYASKSSIDKGKYTFSDVLLPLPGVGIHLPENHTRDLYIVTLQRMGILFNPETKQWDIFRPKSSFNGESCTQRVNGAGSIYHRFSSSFALIEEELCGSTTIVETIDGRDINMEEEVGRIADTTILSSGDASHLRSDLRHLGTPGNPLGVNIFGFYRHVLINPAPTLKWKMRLGCSGDPHQRWALGVQQAFAQNNRNITCLADNSVDGPQQQQKQLLIGHTLTDGSGSGVRRLRRRSVPPTPYWLSKKGDACLELSFELPSNVYPSMLLRELTKSDVNSPETVDLDRSFIDNRAKSWNDLSADQQAVYRRHLAQKRHKLFTTRPRAINVALLHQHIFRSGGMRRSLLPSMRGYDNVSK